MKDHIFSTPDELARLTTLLGRYTRLPFFADAIPGNVMESVFAHIRAATRLETYDFVDVVKGKLGWQIKSTKANTPVTWKRAKLPNAEFLISESEKSRAGTQHLGDAVIDFCNQHVHESIEKYGLDRVGYVRLILHSKSRTVTYFERVLCSNNDPRIFRRGDFFWQWSRRKNAAKKEQLSALHGIHKKTGKRWFAWHGRGEKPTTLHW